MCDVTLSWKLRQKRGCYSHNRYEIAVSRFEVFLLIEKLLQHIISIIISINTK